MKNIASKLISVMLSLVLVIGILPATAFAADEISSVSIEVDAPAVGAKPCFEVTLPDGAKYTTGGVQGFGIFNYVSWSDEQTWQFFGESEDMKDVFLSGHQYGISVYLNSDPEYVFTDNTTATLNGQAAKVRLVYEDVLAVSFSFPILDPEGLESPLGDVGLDGETEASDLTALARHVAGIDPLSFNLALDKADVTADGGIDAADLTKLARFVSKIIMTLE